MTGGEGGVLREASLPRPYNNIWRATESDDERCDSCSVGTPAADTASHVFRFLFDCVSKVKSKSRCNSALVCDMGGGGKQTLGVIVDLIGVINQTSASIFKFTTDY